LLEKEAKVLFGESRKQAVRGLAENLSGVLEVKYGTKQSPRWAIRFRQHPAEEVFMKALRSSEEKLSRGQMELWVLGQHRGSGLLSDLGYREEEIRIILQMLQARRLVVFDAKQQHYVAVLESPDERREAILAALSDLTQQTDVLAQIPEFNRERFSAETGKLSEQISACNDIEILEEYQAQLARLRDELVQLSKKWTDNIQLAFETIHNTTGQVLRTSLPADLTRPLQGGGVNWAGELTHCQMLLKEMYQRGHAAFRHVANRATSVWNTWTDAHPNDAVALLTLYEDNRTVQSELKDAQASLEAARGYLSSYQAWSNVLNAASRTYYEALGCETSYKEGQFRQELATVFDKITDQFQKKRLEALPNHEMYTDQIKDVQEQIDVWLRDRRENFMQDKQSYQETLQSIGVDRSNLRASLDTFDPETSRSNLYDEVLEKTLQHVQSLEQELGRYRTEVLYAERVVRVDVSELATQIRQTRDELVQVKRQVNDECVRQQERFAALGEAISELNTAIQEVSQSIRGILQKRPPTPKEEAVLDILQDPRGTDLSVVITSRLAQESGEFSLDELMQIVTSLFQKNQVIIHLEKRR